VFQFQEVGARDSPFTVPSNQVIQNSRRGRLLDFRHRCKSWKLGVRILFMKNCPFKLVGKISNFNVVLRRLDSAQEIQHGAIGSSNGNVRGFIFSGLRPSCLNSFPCALTSLRWCKFRGPGWTALFAAPSPQSDGGRIFLSFCYGHDYIIRERSRFGEHVSGQVFRMSAKHLTR
jgi:hypothetical protein